MTPVLLGNNANIGLAKEPHKNNVFSQREVVSLTLAQEVIFGSKKRGMTANGLQLRNVGLFETLTCRPVTKVATKTKITDTTVRPMFS